MWTLALVFRTAGWAFSFELKIREILQFLSSAALILIHQIFSTILEAPKFSNSSSWTALSLANHLGIRLYDGHGKLLIDRLEIMIEPSSWEKLTDFYHFTMIKTVEISLLSVNLFINLIVPAFWTWFNLRPKSHRKPQQMDQTSVRLQSLRFLWINQKIGCTASTVSISTAFRRHLLSSRE